jgi:hypothetical protein
VTGFLEVAMGFDDRLERKRLVDPNVELPLAKPSLMKTVALPA